MDLSYMMESMNMEILEVSIALSTSYSSPDNCITKSSLSPVNTCSSQAMRSNDYCRSKRHLASIPSLWINKLFYLLGIHFKRWDISSRLIWTYGRIHIDCWKFLIHFGSKKRLHIIGIQLPSGDSLCESSNRNHILLHRTTLDYSCHLASHYVTLTAWTTYWSTALHWHTAAI